MAKAKKGKKGKQAKLSKKKGKKAKRKVAKKAAKHKAAPKPRITREPTPAPAFTEISEETTFATDTPEEPMMGSTEMGTSESSYASDDRDSSSSM